MGLQWNDVKARHVAVEKIRYVMGHLWNVRDMETIVEGGLPKKVSVPSKC